MVTKREKNSLCIYQCCSLKTEIMIFVKIIHSKLGMLYLSWRPERMFEKKKKMTLIWIRLVKSDQNKRDTDKKSNNSWDNEKHFRQPSQLLFSVLFHIRITFEYFSKHADFKDMSHNAIKKATLSRIIHKLISLP